MLIEFIQGGGHAPFSRRGINYTFKPDPDFDNAVLCDVVDPETVREMLRTKTMAGALVYRKFPCAAVRDPDFLRAIYRNPIAAIEVLEVMLRALKDGKAGELEIDTEGLDHELLQASVDDLQVMAADLDLMAYPHSPRHVLLGIVMPHCKRALREAFPAPMPPTPEEQLAAEGKPVAKPLKKLRAA